jgi:hypothetical protein
MRRQKTALQQVWVNRRRDGLFLSGHTIDRPPNPSRIEMRNQTCIRKANIPVFLHCAAQDWRNTNILLDSRYFPRHDGISDTCSSNALDYHVSNALAHQLQAPHSTTSLVVQWPACICFIYRFTGRYEYDFVSSTRKHRDDIYLLIAGWCISYFDTGKDFSCK